MAAVLERIVAATRARVAEAKRGADLRELERQAELACAARVSAGAGSRRVATGVAVIAELKKASPSKGLIRAEFRPAELARELGSGGSSGAVGADG